MHSETRKFLQVYLGEVVSAETIDWPAYRDLRREFPAWECNALRGFGVRSRVIETEEEVSIYHVRQSCKYILHVRHGL